MFKTFHIFTLGCQMNVSDSERIEAVLEKCGLKPTNEKSADLIIVNACSVRQKPIDRIWGKVRVWSRVNPKAKRILTGCVLSSDLKKLEPKFDFCFKIDDLNDFSQWLQNNLSPMDQDKKIIFSNYLEIESSRQNNEIAYVPIMTGCNNFCSYCVVPHTRGREWSRSPQAIVGEVRCLIKKGHKEIMLLGQNICSYKSQKSKACLEPRREVKSQNYNSKVKSGFVGLLRRLVKIPGDFKISFMSPHPKDFSDELIDLIAKEPKIVKQIHLPLQSGDDKILKKMNRYYTTTQYLKLVDKLRNKISAHGGSACGGKKLSLSTDIIVGFPGESIKSFQKTINLAKKCRFTKAYISIYSPRAGTMADKKFKNNIPLVEKKKRWLVLERLINQKSKIKNIK